MSELVQQHLSHDGILRLTLCDEKYRNALSEAMLDALAQAFKHAEQAENVRVIILGAKGHVFSSGHNLKEMNSARSHEDNGRAYYQKILTACSNLMQAIVRHPKPVIAEVSGIATAAGCQLVASCDLAYAAKSAKFSTPGVNIGLFCSTPMVALSRNINNKLAMEMLLTGEFISAKKAKKIGLVNDVVKTEKLAEKTNAVAQQIAAKSMLTLKIGKSAFYQQKEMPLEKAYRYASDVMVDNMLEEDAVEGINAFIQKRQPQWSDQ